MAGKAWYVIATLLVIGGVALASYSYLFSQARFPILDARIPARPNYWYSVHDLQAGEAMYGYLFVTGDKVDALVLDKETFIFLAQNFGELPPNANPEVFLPGLLPGLHEFSFTASKSDSYYVVTTCQFICYPDTEIHVVLQQTMGNLGGIPIVALYAISGTLIASGVGLLVFLLVKRRRAAG